MIHIDSVTQKLPGDVIPTRIETLASLPPLVTAAKKSHQHHAIDDNTSPYPVGTLFTVPWINPGETAVSLHPAVTVHVIEPEELSFTWAETLLKTTGILAKGRNTISYYDGKTEKIQEVPEGDLIKVIPSELRTVAIPNVSNDVKSQQLRVVVEQLHKKGLIYNPPDMVLWRVIVQPPISVSDAAVVVYRLYFQLIKNPLFQKRAGTALATGGHKEFLKVMGGGPTPGEVAECRGMYNIRKSMLPDFLVQLRRLFPTRTLSHADRLGMLFERLVKAMHGINLAALMSGPIQTVLLFLRWLSLSLRTLFTFKYLIEQVMRGGFNEILPWRRMMSRFPLGVLCFLCVDQNLNTPPYLMLCNQEMFTELGFPFPIQYYSLYACVFDELVRYLEDFGGKMTDRALIDLRRVVDAYKARFRMLPSPKKYKVWVRWLMERATSPSDDHIQRRLTKDFGLNVRNFKCTK